MKLVEKPGKYIVMTEVDSLKFKEFRRPIRDILEDFAKPIPARLLKKKPVFSMKNGSLYKTGEVDYLPWATYVRLLDYFAPGWDYTIETSFDGKKVVVVGSLTIKAKEGDFTRSAIGSEDCEADGYGDAYSNSESSALRRCAAKFGLSLELWETRR